MTGSHQMSISYLKHLAPASIPHSQQQHQHQSQLSINTMAELMLSPVCLPTQNAVADAHLPPDGSASPLAAVTLYCTAYLEPSYNSKQSAIDLPCQVFVTSRRRRSSCTRSPLLYPLFFASMLGLIMLH